MLPATASARTGVFISHAHEDEELAEALREHLETVLGIDRAAITCTSDPAYGLARGGEVDDQIRQRLNSAKALFLIATRASKGKEWVQFECGYADQAHAKGEMQFYVLTPSASQLDAVPAPYRERLAVTLSKAGDLHEFAAQLRKTFGVAGDAAATPRFFETLLKLHARGDEAERRELAETSRIVESQGDRLRRHRLWGMVAAGALAVGLIGTLLTWRGQMATLRHAQAEEIQTLRQAHVVELDRRTLEMETTRDDELRSLPFTGFFQDSSNRVIPCVRVTATVSKPDGTRATVPKDCRAGRFTFGSGELGIDPRERFTMTVDVTNDSRDLAIDRSTLPVALLISGVSR